MYREVIKTRTIRGVGWAGARFEASAGPLASADGFHHIFDPR
jgi:hypothetical protein